RGPAVLGGPRGEGGPGGPGGFGGFGGGGGAGMVGSGWPVLSGPVTSKTLFDTTKRRYLGKPTPQVRRLPVGLVLIVDQTNLQDVLLALANSPLRFQITQVHWARFRGTIAGTEPTYGTPGGEGGPRYTPPPIISGGGFGTGEGGVVRPGRPAGPGFFPVPVGPGSGSVPGPGD